MGGEKGGRGGGGFGGLHNKNKTENGCTPFQACPFAGGAVPPPSNHHHPTTPSPLLCATLCAHNTAQPGTTQHNTSTHSTARHTTPQYNTATHNTTPHHTTQHNTTQHNTTQHNTTQHNTTQHNTTQHNTTQQNTTQHITTQHKPPHHSKAQHSTAQHSITQHSPNKAHYSTCGTGGALILFIAQAEITLSHQISPSNEKLRRNAKVARRVSVPGKYSPITYEQTPLLLCFKEQDERSKWTTLPDSMLPRITDICVLMHVALYMFVLLLNPVTCQHVSLSPTNHDPIHSFLCLHPSTTVFS